jgi:hypothetical protein
MKIKFNVYGSVHRNNILIYIQQDATLHGLFYLETALHVSGGTTTHHQERKQLYLQHLVFVTPLLVPAAYIVYFVWKLLYMFRVVPPPIIRSANNCIYSIWYFSHRYCYLPLSWKSWNWFECAVLRQVAVTA